MKQKPDKGSYVPASTSTAVVTKFLHRLFRDIGLDVDEVFKRSAIDVKQLDDPSARIDHQKLIKMWTVAAELSGDKLFGISLAMKAPIVPFNTVGYLAMSSQNLREGLQNAIHYFKVFSDSGVIKLKAGKEVSKIIVDLSGGLPPDRHHSEFWLTYIMRKVNSPFEWKLPIVKVGFMHAEPDYTIEYDERFGTSVCFSQCENYFEFPSEFLDAESMNANEMISKLHEKQAIEQLHAVTENGILSKVNQAIFESLPAKEICLDDVAEKLNLTARTVQRNLADDGVTFKGLVDKARKEHTMFELGKTSYSISEVAYHLGYRDLSSFYRAFKRWTGMTPQRYRESQKLVF